MKDFILILSFILSFIAGATLEYDIVKHAFRSETITHGKVEYLTAENGKQIWRWKP